MTITSSARSTARIDFKSIRTITVDVFDTILLRDLWPEEVQFIEVAEAWLPYLRRELAASLTSYELVTFRQYARRVLLAAKPTATHDPEVTITEWFDELVRLLAEKYNKHLGKKHQQKIVEELVIRELEVEKRHLQPNTALLKQLTRLKEQLGVKIYFVSDMYLTPRHVKALLQHAKINLFDGGVTSSELSCGKYSGKLYRCLEAYFSDFTISNNLHIGDSHHADYRAAIAEGSQALHYRTFHHFKRWVAGRYQAIYLRQYHKRHQKIIREQIIGHRHSQHNKRPAVAIGRLFAAPLVAYVHPVASRARLQSGIQYVGVSSEAAVFQQTHAVLFGDNHRFMYAPSLNRKTALKAVLAEIALLDKNYSLGAQRIASYGEDMLHRGALLSLLGAHPARLFLESMTTQELRDYMGKHLYSLRDETIGDEVASLLDLASKKDIVLLDVGWGGTIQVFLRDFAALRGYSNKLSGVYMGVQRTQNRFNIERGPMEGVLFDDVYSSKNRGFFVPEIWEYVLSDKHQYSASGRHRLIHEHLLAGVEEWRTAVHCAPDTFWCALQPALLRLLQNPTKAEIETLGSIQFDSGFTIIQHIPLVDMNHNRLKVWLKSYLKPKVILKQLVDQYCWTSGTIRYYRLWHLIPILKIVGFIKRKKYI